MSESPETYQPTERTKLGRRSARGVYDRRAVHAVLDEALICHVAVTTDHGPLVLPTIHTRIGETLYFHGAVASRLLRTMKLGVDVCVTATLVDGLVLARSAFHHSMNYRSVVVFGRATEVTDRDEKIAVLHSLVEHVVPGRSGAVRSPNDSELAQTSVLALPIVEASAKVRQGPPIDDDADHAIDVWAGVLPLSVQPGAPEPDPLMTVERPVPACVTDYRRPGCGR